MKFCRSSWSIKSYKGIVACVGGPIGVINEVWMGPVFWKVLPVGCRMSMQSIASTSIQNINYADTNGSSLMSIEFSLIYYTFYRNVANKLQNEYFYTKTASDFKIT